MSKRKKKCRPMSDKINCFNCAHCIYIEDGDYICDMNNEPVLTDFVVPWEAFYQCNGKDYQEL